MLKKIIKKNKNLHKLMIQFRETLRIIYNTKTRSRFLWNLRKGDTKLTLAYPLNEQSIVIDVGTYKGEFTEKLLKKHDCFIHALEPVEEYYEFLINKFEKNKKIKIHNFGLLDKTFETKISKLEAGSSIFTRSEGVAEQKIFIKAATEFIKEEKLTEIDLLYMNIEGSEYQLLANLIESNEIMKIKHLQVQFHNYVDNSKIKRKEIRKQLNKTHKCIFNFPFIWERWDRRK